MYNPMGRAGFGIYVLAAVATYETAHMPNDRSIDGAKFYAAEGLDLVGVQSCVWGEKGAEVTSI